MNNTQITAESIFIQERCTYASWIMPEKRCIAVYYMLKRGKPFNTKMFLQGNMTTEKA